MSGRGRGGRGVGKGGPKRHRKVLHDDIHGITKASIRRLARRGGVKSIASLVYEEIRGVLMVFFGERDPRCGRVHRTRETQYRDCCGCGQCVETPRSYSLRL
uniref:Histone H4 n=1 Tax=Mesocestoides corti TaxID=53468 RepID=A0A5K3G028_MESCO